MTPSKCHKFLNHIYINLKKFIYVFFQKISLLNNYTFFSEIKKCCHLSTFMITSDKKNS